MIDFIRASNGRWRNIELVLWTVVMVLVAHAVAYFSHEYCHSFMAWLLGFKANPLALNYGDASVANILFQQEIDENVDYTPIFSGNHGLAAALIALSGPGVGNGCLYILCVVVFRALRQTSNQKAAMFVFWLALMCAGNVWSYAPIRTITTHADMALVAQGLGISVWALLPLVTVPSLYVGYHFFFRLFPRAKRALFCVDDNAAIYVSALTAYFYFGFYGDGGIYGHYGAVSAILSVISITVLLPLAMVYCLKQHTVERDTGAVTLDDA
jgi:hypothetical protein